VQDYDEKLPKVSYGSYYWTPTMEPYLKNWQILICPSRNASATEAHVTGTYPHYGLNSDICPFGSDPAVSLAQITMPAETVLVGEANWYTNGADSHGCYHMHRPSYTSGDTSRWIHPHNGGRNLAFVDGHCKWFTRPTDADLRWVP